jgi:hypothetical protein
MSMLTSLEEATHLVNGLQSQAMRGEDLTSTLTHIQSLISPETPTTLVEDACIANQALLGQAGMCHSSLDVLGMETYALDHNTCDQVMNTVRALCRRTMNKASMNEEVFLLELLTDYYLTNQ